MNNKKDFFDAISAVDCARSELGEISEALQLFGDYMEKEGLQTKENFEEWRAIQFSKRFPLYFSSFNVICRDFIRAVDELHTAINTLYAMIGVQNGPNVNEGKKL